MTKTKTMIRKGELSLVTCTLSLVICLVACNPQNTPSLGGGQGEAPDKPLYDTSIVYPSTSARQELYRPQVHYSVAQNWMNDPNGLCYLDGTWHLYYQYNPNGIDCNFGGMSWGHATSTDLMHWTEQPTVLYPDEMGAMFSGCSVVDSDNKAGFGQNAILAFYTASGERQVICLAVSTDGGKSFQKYEHNPIVPSTDLVNFRDPKIVWDDAHQQYVMVIAKGWDQGLEFWRSTNLRDWTFVPYIFHADPPRCNLGQYECPDLFWLPYEGEGQGKWVLVLSTMPGGFINGSGTMYFVGDLTAEGYFVCDEMVNSQMVNWLDFGADYYAAVSWDNAPDNRKVAIGWMNNWDYAPACPAAPWKSAFAFPREYSLRNCDGRTILCSNPVRELESIAGTWISIDSVGKFLQQPFSNRLEAYELQLTCELSEDASIRLMNPYGEFYEVRIDSQCRRIISDRSRSGVHNFASLFAIPSMAAPIFGNAQEITLQFIVDQSSVELFADNGATCVTNTVYPRALYTGIATSGKVKDARFRPLESIWK